MLLKQVALLVLQVLTLMLICKLVWNVVVTARFVPDQRLVPSATLTICLKVVPAPAGLQSTERENVLLALQVSIGLELRVPRALRSRVTVRRAWIQVGNAKHVQAPLYFRRPSLVIVQQVSSSTGQLVRRLLLVQLVNTGLHKTLVKIVVPIAALAKNWLVSVLRALPA